jgi:hypothetical protein
MVSDVYPQFTLLMRNGFGGGKDHWGAKIHHPAILKCPQSHFTANTV